MINDRIVGYENDDMDIYYDKYTLQVDEVYFTDKPYKWVRRLYYCECGNRFTFSDGMLLCEFCHRVYDIDGVRALYDVLYKS